MEYEVKTMWGEFDNYIYPTSESLVFFKSIFREIQSLFPGDYIQLSGITDEKKRVKEKELIELGFKTTKDIDGFFINNLKPWMERLGKKVILRNLDAGTTISQSDVILLSNLENDLKYKLESQVVLNNQNFLNFSKYSSKFSGKHIAFGGYINTKDVYQYHEILNENLNIMGAEASLRSDYVVSGGIAQRQLLPRLCALSEILWTPHEKLNWFGFKSRFSSNLRGKFNKRSYQYSDFF